MGGILAAPQDYLVTRWLFLRLLGLIYFFAFTSFSVQATGLVGKNGILPAGAFLSAAQKALGKKAYFLYPAVFWTSSSDASLMSVCLLGALLSVLLILGLQTTPILALLWIFYLSLVTIGQVFLSFQWDALLMETGFLSLFLIPPSLLPNQAQAPPSPIVIFLFRWLLFRLIFMSGFAKLASGDRTWRNLTAMVYHYETQPLPTPLAWATHRAPPWFQKFSTFFTLFAELAIPFLYLGPSLLRLIGAGFTLVLQLLIMLTGNFAFFNILTISLVVFLFDDIQLRMILPGSVIDAATQAASPGIGVAWGNWVLIPLAVFLILAGILFFFIRWIRKPALYRFVQPVLLVVQTLRIVNSYGLFAAMTTLRPEIVLEGSNDSENWIPYEFKYKPGVLKRAPPLVAPHQPHLDWQMWFAALGSYSDNPWFLHFVERLLEGSSQVTGLLVVNPFPDKPPAYIRAVLYDYHFSTPAEKSETGNWWRRERLGLYLPPVSIESER